MTSENEIFKEILNTIVPTPQDLNLIKDIANKLKTLLEKKASELNIDFTRIEPQGSTGLKQTHLKGDFDIDLFIGLDYDLYKPKYEGLSKSKLKKESKRDFLRLCKEWILPSLDSQEFQNQRLLYAEHPYVTVDYNIENLKIKIDIVLYFDLDLSYIKENGPITAVDRSPWHGRFIRDQLSLEQKNEVRLLKQFFKACHSYGDKSAVGKVGFIGYSAELLIFFFGTLQNLFKSFNNLQEKPLDYYNRSFQKLKKIPHFKDDFLIIVDPIDKNRNVASAISKKAYKYCNERINGFLRNPDKSFFELKEIPLVDLTNSKDEKLSKIYIVELTNENKEIHYTVNRDKLYSLGEGIKLNGEKEFSNAERFGKIEFEVYFENEYDEYNLVIYCGQPIISSTYIRKGPPKTAKLHAIKFMKKNPTYFEKSNYLWVESKRKFTDFLDYLKHFVKNRIPDNLKIINISKSFEVKRSSGKKAITVLKNMILPFS